MKTLREYIDLVKEAVGDTVELSISDMFGGGKIVTQTTVDSNGDVDWYSYSYMNQGISDRPVVRFEVYVGKELSVERFENETLTGEFINITDNEVRTDFAGLTSVFMNEYFTGKRNMKESEHLSSVFAEFNKITDDIIASSRRRQARLRSEDQSVDEGSMTDAEHNPSGPKFGGYYGATQKGPPRPGQGAGGCEESVEHADEQIEEDAADDVIALANEIKRD